MQKNIPFAHFYSWNKINDEMLPNIMSEFRWNGVKDLVFGNILMTRVLHDPAFFGTLRYHSHNQKINLIETHAPYGQSYDLSCPDRGRFASLLDDHIKCMGYSVDCGSMTYTIHIGAWESVIYQTPNDEIRPHVIAKLEKLVPAAEKLGIIIAVENSFERSNTPDEVLYYINYFKSPYLQCCYDAGHANIMSPAPGKTTDQYSEGLKSHGITILNSMLMPLKNFLRTSSPVTCMTMTGTLTDTLSRAEVQSTGSKSFPD